MRALSPFHSSEARRPGAARVAVVFLTPACDLACPYCGASDDFGVLGSGQAVALLDHLVEQGFWRGHGVDL